MATNSFSIMAIKTENRNSRISQETEVPSGMAEFRPHCQKACQFHSRLNRCHTGTAAVCGPCQLTPLHNTHCHPFLEGERAKELCESNLGRKPFIFHFPACMTMIIAKLMKMAN